MGWSLGTNDAANAFGTAVATKVIKYKTAVIIIACFVIVGAFLQGAGNIDKVAELSTANKVTASIEEVKEAIANNTVADLRIKSGVRAAIVFVCAAVTVFLMSYLKFPVSANQSITGAIVGWGLFYADYSDPEVSSLAWPLIGKFASTWLLNPLGAAIISFILVWLVIKFIEEKLEKLKYYNTIVKVGYLCAGAFASYSIGMNSSANVTALYYDPAFKETGIAANLLTDITIGGMTFSGAQVAATIGGIAIAIGVLTYSKRVMMTVGESIAELTPLEGFVVIIAMALTIVLMGNLMHIPVSTSQAVVGAVVGAGLNKGVKNVNFRVFKNIAIAWVSSPTLAGLLAYACAWLAKGYFAA